MAPQPGREVVVERVVEVDMERKEELILAKQLRACRVSILPRVRTGTPCIHPTHSINRRGIHQISILG
jgi:hypothetical protein